MLKIGFDAKRIFNNFTGLGNYSRSLLKDLDNFYPNEEYSLYTPKIINNNRTAEFLNKQKYNVCTPGKFNKFTWRSFSIKKDLVKSKLDIFHGLSHELPFGIQKTGIKSVVTIHDLIFKKFPEQYSKIDNKIYDIKFKYACVNSDKIIALSNSTKNDLINLYGISEEKINVIYQTCGSHFFNPIDLQIKSNVIEKYNLPKEYLLFVGSIIERKNLLSVIKAIEILPKNYQLPLVVIGNGTSYKKKVCNYLAEKNIQNKVIFISNALYSELPSLYNLASIFILPSLYEGFGLPVLESMLCETPVITSNISSLPEVGGPESMYVNYSKIDEISNAIESILSNTEKTNSMIKTGKQFAQNFTSEVITPKVMKLYKDLA